MKKIILKSIAAVVICLGMVCDCTLLSVMAEEAEVPELNSIEEAGISEASVIEEVPLEEEVAAEEELAVSVQKESEAEEIPEKMLQSPGQTMNSWVKAVNTGRILMPPMSWNMKN